MEENNNTEIQSEENNFPSEIQAQKNSQLVAQLKDALLINQVLASSVEILGEAHLTKNEKYEMIRNLNEASSISEVTTRADIIREQFGIQSQSQNFREIQEDDSFWSSSFRGELDNYYDLHKGVNVKMTLAESLIEIERYFKLLTEYGKSNESNVQGITDRILEQEPKARTGLERLKGLNVSINTIQ
jgi:hypothetical protein|tara:strand:- start:9327 stop:9887 length:561 start_codon:yes stop_codon:yes gene_type:complete